MDVPAPPSVPGFALETLVRFSRSGETWVARSAGGEVVSLTLVGDALTSAAEPLRIFRHPDAVPVTDVISAGRCVALVSPDAGPRTLASICAGRPVLDPGEVVTVGVPIARALAAAHDRGLVHGDLDPVDIVIDDEGLPRLAGLGVAALSGAGVAPADDVHALAMILRSLLGDDVGPRAEAIRGALGQALSGHPAARPEAAELAGSLSLTCPPQPLRRPRAEPPPAPAAPERWRWSRSVRDRVGPSFPPSSTAVTAALAVAGLLLIVLAAPLFGHHATVTAGAPTAGAAQGGTAVMPAADPAATPFADPSATGEPDSAESSSAAPLAPAPPAPAPPAPAVSAPAAELSATQWQHTLQRLVEARDLAFVRLDPADLARADAAGSSAAAIDASRINALRAAKVHAAGLTSTVLGVTVVTGGAEAAVLRFEESASAYDLVTAGGIIIEHRPAQSAQTWSVALVRTPGGWRAATATAAAH